MISKRWIYISVMTISGIAFVVDRLFLGSPATAEAKVSAQPSKPAGKPASSEAEKGQSQLVDPSLAWLEKLADPGPARDVFAPSPEWLFTRRLNEQAAGAQSAGPAPGSRQAFQANHELQATTVSEGGGLAVVDGQCLTVGDSLDGFQLVRVTAGRADFQRGRERVSLTLPMPPDMQAARSNESTPHDDAEEPAQSEAKASSRFSLLRLLWGSSRR